MRARLRRVADRLLGLPPVVYSVQRAAPLVALTFDDGPSRWTPEVTAALDRLDARASFFMRGAAVEENPSLAADVARAGHDVGNHLWSHTDPGEQTREELADEISATADTIAAATGSAPWMVRPPYCGAPRAVARAARGTPTRAVVLRSVDPEDWNLESADEIADRTLAEVVGGDIVCLHDGIPDQSSGTASRAPTLAALDRIVPGLRERGLEPVTLSRLLG